MCLWYDLASMGVHHQSAAFAHLVLAVSRLAEDTLTHSQGGVATHPTQAEKRPG